MPARRVTVREAEVREDARGFLFEVLRPGHLPEGAAFGQVYVTAALPGQSKGGHWHERKTEWFCAVRGRGLFETRDPRSGDSDSLLLDAGCPAVVCVPPGVAHRFVNTGSEPLVLVIYASEPFDPEHPDAVPFAFPD
jgi:UDP-2-acetamido-2,6-beta-L-arabino-hexul-4-ose reductase